jgi:uncharacterized protein
MGGGGPVTIDLDALALSSGEGARIDARLAPRAPVVGGEPLDLAESEIDARVDVSRTSSGFALRLRAKATVTGECARCLGAAELPIAVDAREVDQPSADDPELLSPYVDEGILAIDAWVHDAITLALPEQLLCRPDCAGLCDVCGASLNDFAPGEHRHEKPLDPRFAKLRELTDGD